MTEYNTSDDLLKFVLEECSDIVWAQYNTSLIIYKNFDTERVFYAIKLLKEQFDLTINVLELQDRENSKIIDDHLENTQIERLYVYNPIKIGRLPNTIRLINLYDYINRTDDYKCQRISINNLWGKYQITNTLYDTDGYEIDTPEEPTTYCNEEELPKNISDLINGI